MRRGAEMRQSHLVCECISSTPYSLLLTTHSVFLTTDYWLLTTYYLLTTIDYLLMTHYSLPMTNYHLLLTTYYWLITTYYILLTTYYLVIDLGLINRYASASPGPSLHQPRRADSVKWLRLMVFWLGSLQHSQLLSALGTCPWCTRMREARPQESASRLEKRQCTWAPLRVWNKAAWCRSRTGTKSYGRHSGTAGRNYLHFRFVLYSVCSISLFKTKRGMH